MHGTFSGRLHDPCTGGIPPKLLHKDVVISRKHKGDRNEIYVGRREREGERNGGGGEVREREAEMRGGREE